MNSQRLLPHSGDSAWHSLTFESAIGTLLDFAHHVQHWVGLRAHSQPPTAPASSTEIDSRSPFMSSHIFTETIKVRSNGS